MFHVVIFEPEIPPNTGNLIRLSANTGAELHLIKPIGFRLDRKSVRRAGLDYDELATVHVHENYAAARAAICRETGSRSKPAAHGATSTRNSRPAMCCCSVRNGAVCRRKCWAPIAPGNVLSLPMLAGNRSLNLANAAAIAVYEAWRQIDFAGS